MKIWHFPFEDRQDISRGAQSERLKRNIGRKDKRVVVAKSCQGQNLECASSKTL